MARTGVYLMNIAVFHKFICQVQQLRKSSFTCYNKTFIAIETLTKQPGKDQFWANEKPDLLLHAALCENKII